MAEKNVAILNHGEQGRTTSEEIRPPHGCLTPAVDIYQTEEALVLKADLPGLPRDAVEIHVEKGVLTIEGRVAVDGAGERIIGEFVPGPYCRQFRLPDSVDSQQATAALRDGVLTLTIPRAEKARSRRIEIAAA